MNIIDLKTVDNLRLELFCKIVALTDKEMEMFITLFKERAPDLFHELFPNGVKQQL